jgi:hypothetical protein
MNIQELQKESEQLRSKLNASNYETTLRLMQDIDKQITALKFAQLLNGVNSTQQRKREAAAKAWQCEQPTEDITTASGEFHKVKVKKYPILGSLEYCRAKFEDGFLYELRLNGEKFAMYEKKYNGNNPTTYSRPASFAEFLKLNHISGEDITAEQLAEVNNAIKEANEDFKKYREAYDKKMNDLNAYSLNCWGLISQQAQHFYMYQTK